MYKLNNISTPKKLLETMNKVNIQYSTMPEASSLQGKIVQFVGENFEEFKTGYFYRSVQNKDNQEQWNWQVIVGGGGESIEPIYLTDVEIELDTETNMYILSLPDEVGVVYVASGFIIDLESEDGFIESEGNSTIAIWVEDEDKILSSFSIDFGTNSYSYDESWTSADGISYINLEGVNIIEGTPSSIIVDLSYLLSQPITINQVNGLKEALSKNVHIAGSATIAIEDWAIDGTYANYGYRASIAVLGLMENSTGLVNFDDTAIALETLKEGGKTYDGGFYIYASEIPSADITIESYIFWEV